MYNTQKRPYQGREGENQEENVVKVSSMADFQFRTLLYRLGEKLTRQDLDNLLFLCRDIIPVARMERVRTATDLWQALSEKGQLSRHDLSFLATLMDSIDRLNVLDDFFAQGFAVGSPKKTPNYLFLESLLKVGQNLTASEVKDLSYMLQGSVLVNPDKVFSATQMFQMLLQRQVISPANVRPLTAALQSIGRSDATKHLANYVPMPPSQPHMAPPSHHNPAGFMTYQRTPYGAGHYGSAMEGVNLDTPSTDPASQVSLPSVAGSHSSLAEESMAESSDGGPVSIQVSERGHLEHSTVVSHNRAKFAQPTHDQTPPLLSNSAVPFPSANTGVAPPYTVATPNNVVATPHNIVATPNNVVVTPSNVPMPNNVVATPNADIPFGFNFNPLEGGSLNQGSGNLYLLAMKEGQMRRMEQEMAGLQQQLEEQTVISERILHERSGEAETYTVNIHKLQELLALKNREVMSLTEELRGYHANIRSGQAVASVGTEDYYHLNKNPHGYCLIFNNFKFHHPHDPTKAHPDRGGATIDQSHLLQTFKYLRYEVVIKENLTSLQMQDCMLEFATKDHTCFDSFVCCILTHGEDNIVHGADSQELNFQEFAATMKLSPTLRGKPKIFFVQACRGDQERKGFDIQKDDPNTAPHGSSGKITASIPQEADFFFGFATPPGNAAYRSKRHGSWFVSQLCEVLVNHAYTENLSSMMKKVNRKVSDAYTKEGYKQCTESVDRLRKKVHFFHFVKNA